MTYRHTGTITMKSPTMLAPDIHYTEITGKFNIGRTFLHFEGKVSRFASGSGGYNYPFSAKFRIDDVRSIEFEEGE